MKLNKFASAALVLCYAGVASAAETQLIVRDCAGTPRAIETVTSGISQKVKVTIAPRIGTESAEGIEVAIESKNLKDAITKVTTEEGTVLFDTLEPAAYTVCPTDKENFKVSKVTLDREPSGSAALWGGGIVAAAATTGLAVGLSDSSSSSSSSSVTATTLSTSPVEETGSIVEDVVLDTQAEVPSVNEIKPSPKKKVRKPATCNKVVSNARGDSEEACRTNESPTPTSPIT